MPADLTFGSDSRLRGLPDGPPTAIEPSERSFDSHPKQRSHLTSSIEEFAEIDSDAETF